MGAATTCVVLNIFLNASLGVSLSVYMKVYSDHCSFLHLTTAKADEQDSKESSIFHNKPSQSSSLTIFDNTSGFIIN